MQIEQFVLGMFETNCYLVTGQEQGACILIDPADGAEKLIGYMEKKHLVPKAVLLTHGHYDHFLAVPGLQKRWAELPVYCHSLDCPKELEEHDMGMVFPTVTAFANVKSLEEGQELKLAGITFQTLHTPGHTPGSVTFQAGDALFTGDTLFCGSIGRTDFAGGSMKQMRASLKRLAAIPGDYRVYPGHEGLTRLDAEKKTNPYLAYM
jgi:glyoxylase-like metal-dependent hydrolase (beta-lactamase superfamily II)